MGIDPYLYHVATRYLNQRYAYVIKDGEPIIFYTQTNELDARARRVDITTDLKKMLGVDHKAARDIIHEWERDRQIYHKMTENVTLHWQFLNVPLLCGETDEEYNF